MYTHFFRKKQKLIALILLTFGMTITNLGLSLFNSPYLDYNYEEGNIIDFEDQYILPKTSDSLPSSNGVGDQVNVSLHQSYLNNTFNTLLNNSDSNSNKFTLPSPTDTTFNSSFTRFEIENIIAPDKYIEIETGTSNSDNIVNDHAFSFYVAGNGTLNNFTICFSETYFLVCSY